VWNVVVNKGKIREENKMGTANRCEKGAKMLNIESTKLY
jgi:hypothetical protein